MGWRDIWIGDGERYNYTQMCMPQLPWRKTDAKLNFYTKGSLKNASGRRCWPLKKTSNASSLSRSTTTSY